MVKYRTIKTTLFNAVLLFALVIGCLSCDRPNCTNENSIFEKNQPDSKVYKDELVRQLQSVDRTKLSYWLQKYEEKNGKEFLYFYIQGDGLCAKIVLTIKQGNKLEDVREKKGVSYRGAEFTNLKFDVKQDSLSTNFIYQTFDRIND